MTTTTETRQATLTWHEPEGCTTPRGWLHSTAIADTYNRPEGACVGNYLDYGPDHYRTGHETEIYPGKVVSFCQPDKLCRDCQPGNVHSMRYPDGPRSDGPREWRYFETVTQARAWIEAVQS
jgi:hypothetical protein